MLQISADPEDRKQGEAVLEFVHGLPAPDTQRLEIAGPYERQTSG
jgi:hypothetical protein